jgi:hypothetical protein
VWLKVWHDLCRQRRSALEGTTPATLPQVLHQAGSSSGNATPKPAVRPEDPGLANVLAAALSVVLARRGWALDASPGNHVTATREGVVIQPFDAVRRMSARELGWEEWQRTCEAAGISDLDLAEAAARDSVVQAPERSS